MHKTTTFEHGGRVYEIRAIPTLNGWMVRIFVEGIPANGFRALRKIAAFLNLCESNSHNRIRGCGYDGAIRLF